MSFVISVVSILYILVFVLEINKLRDGSDGQVHQSTSNKAIELEGIDPNNRLVGLPPTLALSLSPALSPSGPFHLRSLRRLNQFRSANPSSVPCLLQSAVCGENRRALGPHRGGVRLSTTRSRGLHARPFSCFVA